VVGRVGAVNVNIQVVDEMIRRVADDDSRDICDMMILNQDASLVVDIIAHLNTFSYSIGLPINDYFIQRDDISSANTRLP
jgi:hypothetical protein